MNVLKELVTFCFTLTFFISGTIIAFLQLILKICLKPFNATCYRYLNYYCCYGIFTQLVFLVEWWSGTEFLLYMNAEIYEKYFGKEHAFCIANHTYEIDWILIPIMSEPLKMLGNYRFFAKKPLKYVPAFGWTLGLSENVFLERNFEKDREVIQSQVSVLANYKTPMWLTIYPEGTRFTPEKHEASVEYSTKNNLAILKHHLQPRTKGIITSSPAMRGKIPAIYDFLVAFDANDEFQPTFKNLLKGNPLKCHMVINRIPMENLPEDEIEQELFIREIYKKKDSMKESFVESGNFFKLSGEVDVLPFNNRKRIFPLIWEILWCSLVFIPTLYFMYTKMLSGEFMSLAVTIGTLAMIYFILNKVIEMSENNSSYGKKKK